MRRASIVLALSLAACRSPRATEQHAGGMDASAPVSASPSVDARSTQTNVDDAATATNAANADAALVAPVTTTRAIGPFDVPFEKNRSVYYVVSRSTTPRPARLLANLHGVCNPPGYACGFWIEAAASAGFLVCPSGNSRCGGPNGPPTWTESFTQMDADLEKAIAVVDARHPGEVGRDGAILTGFSMGAAAAYQIARAHPGRWPYLILNESNVTMDKGQLEAAGVRAVALIAGEIGSQLAGERKTVERLAKQGFPARLWIMKGAGHHYSADIDAIMADAIAFVLRHDPDAGP